MEDCMRKLVSIVIPCYRSAEMIGGVVADINREMEKLQEKYRWEIIPVSYTHLRAERSGLFRQVFIFEEKEEDFFPVLRKYHRNRGNLILNMFSRMKLCKLLGKLCLLYTSRCV